MSKFVGTGSLLFEKRIYRAAVSRRLKNTALRDKEDMINLDFKLSPRSVCCMFPSG